MEIKDPVKEVLNEVEEVLKRPDFATHKNRLLRKLMRVVRANKLPGDVFCAKYLGRLLTAANQNLEETVRELRKSQEQRARIRNVIRKEGKEQLGERCPLCGCATEKAKEVFFIEGTTHNLGILQINIPCFRCTFCVHTFLTPDQHDQQVSKAMEAMKHPENVKRVEVYLIDHREG